MKHWVLLDSAEIPGTGSELRLYRHGPEHTIMIPGAGELMSSRVHGGEDALGELTCSRLGERATPRILIGGLGVGFTLAAALRSLGPEAEVVVAELIPAVVEWNRGPLGVYAGHPLRDPRVRVVEDDVAAVIRSGPGTYDAILLDVDNGPEGLVRRANDRLYSRAGLKIARAALRPGGILSVWSAAPDAQFSRALHEADFAVEELRVRAHRTRKGETHTVWIATRPA